MKWNLVFILITQVYLLQAQNKKLEKADGYFAQSDYFSALELFLENENKLTDPYQIGELKLKIAHCYFELHQPEKAVENYEKAMLFEVELSAEQYIDYSSCLIETGKYELAKKTLNEISTGMYAEQILIDKCNYALENPSVDESYKLYELNELAANPAYGISLYRNRLLYVFNNEQQYSKSNPGKFGYLGRYDEVLTDLTSLEFPGNANSPVLFGKEKVLYFCATSSYQKELYGGKVENYIGLGGIDNLFLYSAKIQSDNDAITTKLPFNNVDFSCTHPCLSKDGSTMYFASNMLGGYGDFDIYVVKRTKNGWGSPQNMGPKINSFLNEGYPFVEGEYLYFSSEGLPGYGGLDIFRYNLVTEEIENLGKPINSSYDDFYFIKNNAEGYFVSNRAEDFIGDLIYKFVEE